ncbi:unnamed protein product [Adineta steineri]|nr:unnamed protein product [Adineta steineri]
MFIISAQTLFDPNIRHHVYNVAEHYFSLFNPCLIKRLNRLRNLQDKYAQMNRLKTNDQFREAKHTEEKNLTSLIDTYIHEKLSHPHQILQIHIPFDLYDYSDNERKDLFPPELKTTTVKLLQPLYKALVEIIYDRLQNQICRSLQYDVREAPFSSQSLDEPLDDSLRFSIWSRYFNSFITPKIRNTRQIGRHIIKQRMIRKLFENEVSKQEITYLVKDGLSHLRPILEQERRQLIHEIQALRAEEDALNTGNNHRSWHWPWWLLSSDRLEGKHQEVSVYHRLLDRFNRPSNFIPDICRDLREKLNEAAEKQVAGWISNTYAAYDLGRSISENILEHTDSTVYKTPRRNHQKFIYKPIPTIKSNVFRNRFY